MTSPEQSGEQPYRPGAGSDGPAAGGDRPAEPVPRSWDWAIDPPPPEGPTREPAPDPAAGSTVDEVPEPFPSTGRFPDTVAPGAGPPSPPDWSTPQTRASTPPLSGYPPPAGDNPPPPGGPSPQPPTWPSRPPQGGAEPSRPPPGEAEPARPPAGLAKAPEFVRQADRRWWFVLGLVAALLSCCCVAAAVIVLAWGPDIYTGLRDRSPRVVDLNQAARDGDLEFRVRELRCGLTEVGDPLVSQLAVGQFCVVDLAVRNLGTRPVTFQDTLQVAYGPAGQRFGVDSSAGLLANADRLGFLSEINPGNRVTGVVVYDIPPDARIVRLRLRASATSPGIQVRTG
ncbi:DUF4352 domain-containing protein [Micromonospora sp. WMMD1102]|uniref:DUF4352 domain-containing protein n=1 Tax=Micromonospora sp. WMMD1102 TaxID=3016105 RepID=UPI002415355D|nr:DUF4352 domain-containing protein [Micromonospora sp. WMMD1102]MDG4790613.1 DUF4352 domain-containing protein [Micromonospora sp. WMMD1102]